MPNYIDTTVIDKEIAMLLEACLSQHNYCEFPDKENRRASVAVRAPITWHSNAELVLISEQNITIEENGFFENTGAGALTLKAGFGNADNRNDKKPPIGTVVFNHPGIAIKMNGDRVEIYYNPIAKPSEADIPCSKYWNPQHYSYSQHINPECNFNSYMMINNLKDLYFMRCLLSASYALSQSIDAGKTYTWFNGSGFEPTRSRLQYGRPHPFAGYFNGNGHTIYNLYINRPNEDKVGLFGGVAGSPRAQKIIRNLVLENASITGQYYVGALIGITQFTDISNVSIINSIIRGRAVTGGLIGTGNAIFGQEIDVYNTQVEAEEFTNQFFGSLWSSKKPYINQLFFKPDRLDQFYQSMQHSAAYYLLSHAARYFFKISLDQHMVRNQLAKMITVTEKQSSNTHLGIWPVDVPASTLVNFSQPESELLMSIMKLTIFMINSGFIGFVSGAANAVFENSKHKKISQLFIKSTFFTAMILLNYSLISMAVCASLQLVLQKMKVPERRHELIVLSTLLMLNTSYNNPFFGVTSVALGVFANIVGCASGKASGNTLNNICARFIGRQNKNDAREQQAFPRHWEAKNQ